MTEQLDPDNGRGWVLCDKHGYFWWEDGCLECISDAEKELADQSGDPEEIDWKPKNRPAHGHSEPQCIGVWGFCLIHERPIWMCD